jgi:hypothetical protein
MSSSSFFPRLSLKVCILKSKKYTMKQMPKSALCLGLFVLIGLSCCQRVSVEAMEVGPISTGFDWRNVALSKPVTSKWDVQAIAVSVTTKHESSVNPLGIRLEDGSNFAPEIQLVDQTGRIEQFRLVGFSNSDLVFENDRIARGSSFSELRIRSAEPLVCGRLRWISYMPQDTKAGVP